MVCSNLSVCIYASVLLAIIWLVVIPLEIYCTIRFYRYRYHPGISTRYPIIVTTAAIFWFFHTLIVEQFYFLESGIGVHILRTPFVLWIGFLIFPPFLLSIAVFTCFRLWIIHYNINYAVSQSKHKWQNLLLSNNQNIANKKDCFYARNIDTFGSWKDVKKYFIFYFIIGTLCEIAITICEHPFVLSTSHSLSNIVYVLVLLPLIIFGLVLVCKTPSFEDTFFVRKEMKYLYYLSGVCVTLYVAMIFLGAESGNIYYEIQTTSLTTISFGSVFITEYIVLQQVLKNDNNTYRSTVTTSHIISNSRNFVLQLMGQFSNVSDYDSTANLPTHKLFNILIGNDVGINCFMAHLRSEFTLENILCFIEMIQFIYIATNREFDKFATDMTPFTNINFQFAPSIPMHSDMNDTDINNRWWHIIELIYNKYIHSSAKFQINLPYQIQIGFANLINLYQMKMDIQNGTYKSKYLPKENRNKTKSKNAISTFWKNNVFKMSRKNILAENQELETYVKSKIANKTIKPRRAVSEGTVLDYAVCAANSNSKLKINEEIKQEPAENEEKVDNFNIINEDDEEYDHFNEDFFNEDEITKIDDNVGTMDRSQSAPDSKRNNTSLAMKISAMFAKKPSHSDLELVDGGEHDKCDDNTQRDNELKQIEMAKKVNVHDFVAIACQSLRVILQLNYQSVSRFKRTNQFQKFKESVNLSSLLIEFVDKGVTNR